MKWYEVLSELSLEADKIDFLKDLLTPKELLDLEERFKVCKLLCEKELSYRKIKELTGASLTTIGRVARVLKEGTGYKKALDKK